MKRWNILSKYQENTNLINYLLENRGLKTNEEKDNFLNPPLVEDCFLNLSNEFKDSLNNAKDIILSAIKDNTHIIIYGDYDSDGINATAILYSTIKEELNYDNISYFIPSRFEHGYGLSIDGINVSLSKIDENNENKDVNEDKNKNKDKDNSVLFITVDTGITGVEEVEYIKKLGYKVIISDHHQKPNTLPNCDCLVWSDEIVGSGISLFLSRILGSKNLNSLCYAAIATVTDVYPLLSINRSIVSEGLKILANNPPAGIKKLMEIAGKDITHISTYDLGWVIGPRLNATGRIHNATKSLQLLLEKDENKLDEIVYELNKINVDRQDKTIEMYEMAAEIKEENLPKIIFSESENYHEGIIGLVAGRLTQKYYRPSVVISLSNGFGKGSVRSVDDINIIEILRKYEDLFEELGGHPMAAGFSIKKENIPILKEKILEYADKNIDEDSLIPEIDIDLEIPINLVSLDLLNSIEKLKPFGLGNSEPTFVSKNISVSGVRFVGKENNHMLLKLIDENNYFYKGIYFNGKENNLDLSLGDKIDIVYTLGRNEYNNSVYVDLIIKDIKRE